MDRKEIKMRKEIEEGCMDGNVEELRDDCGNVHKFGGAFYSYNSDFGLSGAREENDD